MQTIIGESEALSNMLSHISRVAPIDRPVLVVGERGSGKELAAERLHYLSSRWSESFQKVNCAAISESLLESELFGHEAGAFTGATRAHKGRFERANGGTLFLDELATMPLRVQEKLLRVLEYGEYERLGGKDTLYADVRVLGATNADLQSLAGSGEFRPDLLDRLAFDVINVPPLRERKEDILALVEHFAVKMTNEMDRSAHYGFSDNAQRTFLEYAWPGNVRELKNAVDRSVVHWQFDDQPIDKVILNPFVEQGLVTPNNEVSLLVSEDDDLHEGSSLALSADAVAYDFQGSVKRYELELLNKGLVNCGFHQKKTAEYLGLTYHQLRALMRKYKEQLVR